MYTTTTTTTLRTTPRIHTIQNEIPHDGRTDWMIAECCACLVAKWENILAQPNRYYVNLFHCFHSKHYLLSGSSSPIATLTAAPAAPRSSHTRSAPLGPACLSIPHFVATHVHVANGEQGNWRANFSATWTSTRNIKMTYCNAFKVFVSNRFFFFYSRLFCCARMMMVRSLEQKPRDYSTN